MRCHCGGTLNKFVVSLVTVSLHRLSRYISCRNGPRINTLFRAFYPWRTLITYTMLANREREIGQNVFLVYEWQRRRWLYCGSFRKLSRRDFAALHRNHTHTEHMQPRCRRVQRESFILNPLIVHYVIVCSNRTGKSERLYRNEMEKIA